MIQSQFPTSSGFTTEVVNGGELENRGVELGLNAIVMQKDDFSWNASLKWWKNKSEVTSLACAGIYQWWVCRCD